MHALLHHGWRAGLALRTGSLPARQALTGQRAGSRPAPKRSPSGGRSSCRWRERFPNDLEPGPQVQARAHDDMVDVPLGERGPPSSSPVATNSWTSGIRSCSMASSTTPSRPSRSTLLAMLILTCLDGTAPNHRQCASFNISCLLALPDVNADQYQLEWDRRPPTIETSRTGRASISQVTPTGPARSPPRHT